MVLFDGYIGTVIYRLFVNRLQPAEQIVVVFLLLLDIFWGVVAILHCVFCAGLRRRILSRFNHQQAPSRGLFHG